MKQTSGLKLLPFMRKILGSGFIDKFMKNTPTQVWWVHSKSQIPPSAWGCNTSCYFINNLTSVLKYKNNWSHIVLVRIWPKVILTYEITVCSEYDYLLWPKCTAPLITASCASGGTIVDTCSGMTSPNLFCRMRDSPNPPTKTT